MTKFNNILKSSIKNIIANKLRSVLTMLGLIIGITSVIVLVGIGNGTSSTVQSQIQSLGSDVITVIVPSSDAALSYNNVESLLNINNIQDVAPYKNVSSTVSREGTTSSRASIISTTPSYMNILGLTISSGRMMSQIDMENNSKVCLIGTDLAATLFNLSNPVGQTIKIDGDHYTVIGVITSTGSTMGNNIDQQLIIPLTTAKYLGVDTSVNSLYIQVEDDGSIDSTVSYLESYIASLLGITTDDFTVSSQEAMLETMDSVSHTLSLLLGGIASISLIVGGIGVMNVMLVSVTERTKEIGIRKALGAKRQDILLQFLIEALVLCLIGGILGIIFGVGLGLLLSKVGYTFTPGISIIFIAFISSALIGTVFGIFPAYKASMLHPIDALRQG